MHTDEARAFWIAAPGRGEIRTEPLPPPRQGDVVVRTLYTGISRGTEALVFHGRVPASERQRMRAPFQAGDFPAPVKYGYAHVGRIESGAGDFDGRVIFALYPHQTRYVVPRTAVHVVPAEVPPARAVLAANLETAVNAVWDAQVQPGDHVSVIGAGTVGCLTAWLCARIPGCEVQIVDINERRRDVARELNATFATPDQAFPERDLVIHASGSPDGLSLSCSIAAFEATVLELSWYGDRHVTMPLGEAFHSRRLTIKSSQVGHVPPSHRARWDTRRRMQLALSLLTDPVLDCLITGESDFDDLPRVMETVAESNSDTICHRIRYSCGVV